MCIVRLCFDKTYSPILDENLISYLYTSLYDINFKPKHNEEDIWSVFQRILAKYPDDVFNELRNDSL